MKEFNRLVEIVKILRSDNGCPWDREQTLFSLKNAFLEESCELVHALDTRDIDNIEEELGDVLLHIVMHSEIAESDDLFTLAEVIDGINTKLVRRHPHVFGNEQIDNTSDVINRWAEIKKTEKDSEHQSILDNIPQALPSIVKAQKIQKRVSRVGFDWNNVDEIFDKLEEEIEELRQAYKSGDKHDMQEELGDTMFVLANLASHMKVDADESLRSAIIKFKERFNYIENVLKAKNKTLEETPVEILEKYWQEAKSQGL